MKRRDYIKTMMLATGGLYLAPQWLVSCKSDARIVDLIAGNIKWQPLNTFEEIRNASRLSKGHLRYEMQRLIDAKNAAAIYNFVNERLKTIPAFGNSIYYDYETVRWGESGLLRYGKGTLREKSDLLFNMLKKAGFSPSYHYDSIPITPKQLQQIYCSEKENHSFIEAPNSYIKSGRKRLERRR